MSEAKMKKIEKRLTEVEREMKEVRDILDKTYGNSLALKPKKNSEDE
jgi:predicted nucleic acid-binding Zn finger protein|tara:strand:+ start:224 stop:364 length:141 start_codon:yes stop_codon:yes gene_type:complete